MFNTIILQVINIFGYYHLIQTFNQTVTGGRGIEPMILQEASHLHRALHDTRCEPFDIHDLLTQATCNVITTVTIGSRYDYSDERLENIQLTEYVGLTLLTQAIPVLKVRSSTTSILLSNDTHNIAKHNNIATLK